MDELILKYKELSESCFQKQHIEGISEEARRSLLAKEIMCRKFVHDLSELQKKLLEIEREFAKNKNLIDGNSPKCECGHDKLVYTPISGINSCARCARVI